MNDRVVLVNRLIMHSTSVTLRTWRVECYLPSMRWMAMQTGQPVNEEDRYMAVLKMSSVKYALFQNCLINAKNFSAIVLNKTHYKRLFISNFQCTLNDYNTV